MAADPNDVDALIGQDDDEGATAPATTQGDTSAGALSALDVPGAAQAITRLINSSNTARAALKRARAQIMARHYNRALPWFAISEALSKPTRTGSFGEVLGNLSAGLQGPIRERQAFEEQRQKELLGIDESIAGVDQRTATAELQLAALRAKLANQAANAENDKVLMPDGSVEYRSRAAARTPGTKAYVPPPTPPGSQYQHYEKNLPNGMKQPMRFNTRTGEEEPTGEAYMPVVKLTGNAALQAQGKLANTLVLRDQLNELKQKWFGYTEDENGVRELGLKGKGAKHPGLQGTMSAGRWQGWVPSESGEAFDKAVDTMRGTIRQLTRVPGEGSMSDWEGKIDQAKLPSRGDYESVTEDTFDRLERLINGYENATRQMLPESLLPGTKASEPAAPMPKTAAAPTPAPPAPASASSRESASQSAPEGANPDDYAGAVAPPEALATLKGNPAAKNKARFMHAFGYLPKEYPWDAATRGEYVKLYRELPDGYD